MSDIATIVVEGDTQVVRLPEAFRLPGDRVRLRRSGESVVLEPVEPRMSWDEIGRLLDELDRYRHVPFLENGREQPVMPDDDDLPSFET